MDAEDILEAAAEEAPLVPPPVSGDRITLSATPEYACYKAESEHNCWAVASFKAPFYEPTSRAPVDIVAVIDKSGSMRGTKIELVKKTLLFVIDQLKDCDRISLVTYDTNVKLDFGLMQMDKQNKERAKAFVESLCDGSSTNLCGGLLKGMEQITLTQGGEKAQVQSVLLLTDGLANHWITTKEGIVAEMKKMQDQGLGAVTPAPPSRGGYFGSPPAFFNVAPVPNLQPGASPNKRGLFKKKKKGVPPVQQQVQMPVQQMQVPQQMQMPVQQQQMQVPVQQQSAEPQKQQVTAPAAELPTDAAPMEIDPVTSGYKFDGTVYTFGFGSDHDSNLLEAISTQGGGVYYYIDSHEKIPESFADCLGGLLSVMGQNLSLKMDTVGDYSFKDVHANRMINWSTPNKSCEIPMGDIQSEEERDIVMELLLPALPAPVKEDPVVKVQLSYFNIITSQLDTIDFDLVVDRSGGEKGPGNMIVDIQRNRVTATSVLKTAEALANSGKLSDAQTSLKEAISVLEASMSKDERLVKALISDLKKCLDSMKTQQSYMSHGRNLMANKKQSHSVQRSNYVDEFGDGESYVNFSKAMYKSRAKAVSKK